MKTILKKKKLQYISKTILKIILIKFEDNFGEYLKRMMNDDGGPGTQQEQGLIVTDPSLR